MQIENVTQQEGKRAVRQIVDPLWKPGKKSDWRPPEGDRRLTWALSKKMDEEFVTSILAEQRLIWN